MRATSLFVVSEVSSKFCTLLLVTADDQKTVQLHRRVSHVNYVPTKFFPRLQVSILSLAQFMASGSSVMDFVL